MMTVALLLAVLGTSAAQPLSSMPLYSISSSDSSLEPSASYNSLLNPWVTPTFPEYETENAFNFAPAWLPAPAPWWVGLVPAPAPAPAPACGANEEFTECGSSSCWEGTCASPTVGPACTADCRQGCRCRQGYVRNEASGACVQLSQCYTIRAPAPAPAPACSANEEFTECGSSSCWEGTCASPTVGPACTEDCRQGCHCRQGYVRNEASGACVQLSQCSSRVSPGPGIAYDELRNRAVKGNNDYTVGYVSSAASCQARCDATPDCRSIDFHVQLKYCTLSRATAPVIEARGYTLFLKRSVPVEPAVAPPGTCADSLYWRDQDGDGCVAYANHPYGAAFACGYPGYEEALVQCPATCRTCSQTRDVLPNVPRACCMAYTAQCLACAAGMSTEQYCANNPAAVGCPMVPTTPRLCCMAYTAQCLACSMGLSEEQYCAKNPATSGCDSIRLGPPYINCNGDSDCAPDSYCATLMLGTECIKYRRLGETCGVLTDVCEPRAKCDESNAYTLRAGEGICRLACLGVGGSCEYTGDQGRPPAPVMGRPFMLTSGTALLAGVRNSSDASWCDVRAGPHSGDAPALTAQQEEVAQKRWLQDAQAEHASVASFSRFSLQLMSVAAPSDLVAAAHSAALDEINHAKACFGMAKAFSPSDTSNFAPGAFAIPAGSIDVSDDVGKLVTATLFEGCVGETVSTVQARHEVQLLQGQADPRGVRSVLDTIFSDEARHAALAWRTVQWAAGPSSPDAAAAKTSLEMAVKRLEAELATLNGEEPLEPPAFPGAPLSASTKRTLRALALQQVIIPALKLLFEGKAPMDITSAIPNAAAKATFEAMRQEFMKSRHL